LYANVAAAVSSCVLQNRKEIEKQFLHLAFLSGWKDREIDGEREIKVSRRKS